MRIVRLAKDKQWTGVDLDGTLAEYHGFKGPDIIGDPVPKMVAKVKKWLADGKTVKIFTARAAGKDSSKAIKAIKEWCKEHIGEELEVTCEKDHYMDELWDDRAVRVKKNDGTRVASDQFGPSRKALGAEVVDNLLANFGLGPKYVPKTTSKKTCPKCGSKKAYVKEFHPDTDINEMGLYCPDCRFSEG